MNGAEIQFGACTVGIMRQTSDEACNVGGLRVEAQPSTFRTNGSLAQQGGSAIMLAQCANSFGTDT
jgi:hypothetical protein